MFAEIIINSNARALNKTFDYIVPKELESSIKIGSRVFAPFGKSSKLEDGFVINLKQTSEFSNDSDIQLKEIAKIEEIDSLSESKIKLAKLMARKYFCNISDCIAIMLTPGTSSKKISARMKQKNINFVYLKESTEKIEKDIEDSKLKRENHIKVLRFLYDNSGISHSDLITVMGVSASIIKTIEKNGYIEIKKEGVYRNPFVNKKVERDTKKSLNEEQSKCFNSINDAIQNDKHTKALIYGVTGSGKTEIYMQLIEKVLEKGKDAICLVPEISLTPQMIDRFLARFGNIVAVLHSKLSNGERYDEWKKIASGEKKIVIGARSAVFAPVNNLGIIVIDEEHDQSYKADSTPRYNAKDIAKFLCQENSCPFVLGSATPDMSSMYLAKKGDMQLFELKNRANNAKLPDIQVVDLRNELAVGNKSMLSLNLQNEIRKNLACKEQTILYLNRRGYSTFIMCRDCGFVAKCPNCNISLTYHMSENKLKCHYCGYESKVITQCLECGSKKIKYFGTGTQKLENEIHKLFPDATTLRMDLDTVSKKNSHEKIINEFKEKNTDILIGTQMVVKGHHFPKVTLVGVIAADSNLNIEDYRNAERTFQTIVQVAGRAGRENPGRVIIQTYNPDHYAIVDSQKQDYDLFYSQEIEFRKALNYPPFCDIILVGFSGKNLKEIMAVSDYVYRKLSGVENSKLTIYKPVSCPIDKIKNNYRWRIVIKGHVTSRTIDILNYAINDDNIKKLKDTKIIVDINPNSMM